MKQTVRISGRLLSPLKIGAKALISYGGDFIRTSRVVEILEVSDNLAHFETMNTIYSVSLISYPVTAEISHNYAKCA